jgi:hypothetical protein
MVSLFGVKAAFRKKSYTVIYRNCKYTLSNLHWWYRLLSLHAVLSSIIMLRLKPAAKTAKPAKPSIQVIDQANYEIGVHCWQYH